MSTNTDSYDASRLGAFVASQFGDARNRGYRPPPSADSARVVIHLDGYWYNPGYISPVYSGMRGDAANAPWAQGVELLNAEMQDPISAAVRRVIISGVSWWEYVYPGIVTPRSLCFPNGAETPWPVQYRSAGTVPMGPTYPAGRWDAVVLADLVRECLTVNFAPVGSILLATSLVNPVSPSLHQTDVLLFLNTLQSYFPGHNIAMPGLDTFSAGRLTAWLHWLATGRDY